MILLIDNYDSFSYNLFQLIGSLDPDVRVVRNDAVTLEEIEAMGPRRVILSPGPGRPADAGICEAVVLRFAGSVPILGVCLGHQAICEAFGAEIVHAKNLMHGKQSVVMPDPSCPLFRGLPEQIPAGRYHSLAAAEATLPEVLRVTARADDGELMAVRHVSAPVFGVQFHPESILTPDGAVIMQNFLSDRVWD